MFNKQTADWNKKHPHPHHRTNPALSPLIATETSDTEITTTEIIKRRDVGPYGIRSEYCIRKIICPLGVPETPKGETHIFFDLKHVSFYDKILKLKFRCLPTVPETHTPQRKGLRSSALRPKKPEPAKQTGPVVIETWVAEEELDLWEIRAFSERSDNQTLYHRGLDLCQVRWTLFRLSIFTFCSLGL